MRISRLVPAIAAFAVTSALTYRASAASGTELIKNGSFDEGFASWERPGDDGSSCGSNFHVDSTGNTGCLSVSGNATPAAYTSLDGDGPVTYTLRQTFTGPANVTNAVLSFRDAYIVSYSGDTRVIAVRLYAGSDVLDAYTHSTAQPSSQQDWTFHTADVKEFLKAHAGMEITLAVENIIPQSYTGPAGYGIDDISLLYEAIPPVAISPENAEIHPKGSIAFGASGGGGSGYTWSLVQNESGGFIDSSTGAYTAGPSSGEDVISVTDPNGITSTTSIWVGPGVSIFPANPSVSANGSLQLSAEGGSKSGYTWSLHDNNSGATIDPSTGLYHAGPNPLTVDVVLATDSAGNVAAVNIDVGYPYEFEPRDPNAEAKPQPVAPKSGDAELDLPERDELDREDDAQIAALGGSSCSVSSGTTSHAPTFGIVAAALAVLGLRRRRK